MSDSLNSIVAKVLQRSSSEPFAALKKELDALVRSFTNKQFFFLFAISPRRFKQSALSSSELLSAHDPYQVLSNWNAGQLARLHILLTLAQALNDGQFKNSVNELFKSADVNEQVLLVQSLAFLPGGASFVERAREAARSNIESVFCAVAHDSDYAKNYFDLAGWNQLVLKAAFLAVPIWNIAGLRERNNPELVTMLSNYARERQAAGRTVPWDLYCCPGWLASAQSELAFMQQQFTLGSKKIKAAIVLALLENPAPAANSLAKQLTSTQANSWQDIAKMEP